MSSNVPQKEKRKESILEPDPSIMPVGADQTDAPTSSGGVQRFGSTVRAKTELPSDLKEILETEQQLCQRLKENYEVLKRKYRDLQDEYNSLNRQYLELNRQKLDTELQYQKDLDKVSGDLQRKVAFLEAEQEQARQKFEEFKTGVKTELKDEYGAVVEKLGAELDQTKRAFNALALEKAQTESVANSLMDRLKTAESNAQRRVQEIREENELEKKELLKRIQELSGNSDEAVVSKKQLEADNKRLMDKLKGVLEESTAEKESLNERGKKLSDELKLIKKELDQTEDERRNSKFELTEAKKQNKRLSEEVEKLHKNEETLENKTQKLETEKELANLDWAQKLDKLKTELQERNVDFDAKKAALNRRILEKDGRISELESQIASLQRKEDERSIQEGENVGKESTAVESVEVKKLMEEKKHLEKRIGELKEEQGEKELNRKDHEHDWKLKLRELEWERDSFRKELERLRQKFEKRKTDKTHLESIQSELTKKTEQLQSANERISELLMGTAGGGASKQEGTNERGVGGIHGISDEDAERLKEQLLRARIALKDKDKEITELKRHYRTLLKDMKRSHEKMKYHYQVSKLQSRNSGRNGSLPKVPISPQQEKITPESVAALEEKVEKLRTELNKNQKKQREFGKLLEMGELELLDPILADEKSSANRGHFEELKHDLDQKSRDLLMKFEDNNLNFDLSGSGDDLSA